MSDEAVDQQNVSLSTIRAFLDSKTCYDVLPVSFKLVMLDSTLSLKGALLTMLQNGVVSAPIWDSKHSRFSGLITASDFVSALRYYVKQPRLLDELNHLQLSELSGIEEQIGVSKIDTVTVSPNLSLGEACKAILDTKAHRIALIDTDPVSNRKIVVSVLTQYRVLRFVALNCKETQFLKVRLCDLNIVTKEGIVSTTMNTPLTEVVTLLSSKGISALPVIDEQGKLLNMYELYDVLTLIKGNGYDDLEMTVGEALMRRAQDFEGVLTCRYTDSLSDIMETIRRSRLLRLFVLDDTGRLEGVITLSDILRYLCESV